MHGCVLCERSLTERCLRFEVVLHVSRRPFSTWPAAAVSCVGICGLHVPPLEACSSANTRTRPAVDYLTAN